MADGRRALRQQWNDKDFSLALLIGGLLGFALACMLIFLPFVRETDFVYRWQTLIAGIISIVAAAVALWAVRQQIRHAQQMEDKRRERQAYAARKMLPHALASLSQYAASCLTALRDVEPADTVALDLNAMSLTPISGLDLEPIKQLLEHGERDIQDRLSELLLSFQQQQSRPRPELTDDDPDVWIFFILARALEIHALSAKLDGYVRNDEVPSPLAFADIQASGLQFDWTQGELESLRSSYGAGWT